MEICLSDLFAGDFRNHLKTAVLHPLGISNRCSEKHPGSVGTFLSATVPRIPDTMTTYPFPASSVNTRKKAGI